MKEVLRGARVTSVCVLKSGFISCLNLRLFGFLSDRLHFSEFFFWLYESRRLLIIKINQHICGGAPCQLRDLWPLTCDPPLQVQVQVRSSPRISADTFWINAIINCSACSGSVRPPGGDMLPAPRHQSWSAFDRMTHSVGQINTKIHPLSLSGRSHRVLI